MTKPTCGKLWLLLALLLLVPVAGRTQGAGSDNADLGETASLVRELRSSKNKTLILVFDVSGSMLSKVPGSDRSYLERAREATINLLREGTSPGDRVALLTFGAGYRTVFDRVIKNEGEKDDLVALVPSQPGAGAGTNIRKPHHDALKLLDAALPRPGAVVLLTDSFNDEPKRDDPAYAEYLKYYTPGGRLAVYPDTPENRDYERLLRKLQSSRRVNIYGIGVRIDQSGRPMERLPQAVPETPEPPITFTPAVTMPAKKDPELPWLWIGLGLLALVIALFALLPLTRSMPLRIAGGPAGPREFQVRHNRQIRLGGDGANFAHDAYPLPGVAQPAALIQGLRGQLRLLPASGPKPDASAPKVFHNGLPLESVAALTYDDEVRVSVPDPSGVAREFRLTFEDPTKNF